MQSTIKFRQGQINPEMATTASVNAKQDTLISGTNIKTVNGNTLLGSGNININLASQAVDVVFITSTTTISTLSNLYIVATASPVSEYTITLPDVVAAKGYRYSFVVSNPGNTNKNVIISTASGTVIQADETTQTQYLLELNEEFVSVFSDGIRWWVISE